MKRLTEVLLALLVVGGTAEAQDAGNVRRAYFPRQGWGYVATSPDAPSLRIVGVFHAKAVCEFTVGKERQTPTPGIRMSYTACEPVALGQTGDEAWWLFSIMSLSDPPVTNWGGATEQAMCEQVRGSFVATQKHVRVGRACQPAHLKMTAERVTQPAHSLIVAPQFPAQGWGYVMNPSDRPGRRVLHLHAAKSMCEIALRNTPRNRGAASTDCRPIRHGGGIDSSGWWVFHFEIPAASMTSWIGTSEQADCGQLRESMADPTDPDPIAKQVRLGTCQRVLLEVK